MSAAASTISMEDCPESTVLERYLLGKLPGDEFESIDSHVSSCDLCGSTIRSIPVDSDELTSQLGRIPIQTEFGEYDLVLRMGRGGMGSVYRARHRKLEQDFALKVIRPELQSDTHFAARFEREIKSLGRVNSPNVVQSINAGEWNGTPFIVMELVDGCDLETLIRQNGVLATADAAEIVAQMAAGLRDIHDLDLVHRDLHPGNVLLSRRGEVKIGDLGLITTLDRSNESVGLTDARDRLGAEAFMAPEQRSRPDDVTQAADLFSLGCVWYYLLTGRALIRDSLTHQVMRLNDNLKAVPRSCRPLMSRLLSNEPAARPECAEDVIEALQSMRRKARLAELFSESPEHKPRASRYSIAAGTVVLLTAVGLSAWSRQTPEPTVTPYHEQAPEVIQIPYEQGGTLVRQFYFEAFPQEYTLELIDDRQALLSKGLLSTWWYMDCIGNPTETRIAITERSPRPSVTIKLRPGTHKISAMSVRADPIEVSGEQVTKLVDHAAVIFHVYPDLAVRNCEVFSDHMPLGEEFDVSLELTNRGTVEANAGVLRVFLNPTEPSFISGQITDVSYPALRAGMTERVRLSVKVPDDFRTGPAFISVFIDATETTRERDELKTKSWREGKANDFHFITKKDPKGPPQNNNGLSIAVEILTSN